MKFNKSILSNQNSKRTIQYLALLLILFLSLNLNLSCEKGTEPDQLKPGRRDYVWEVDSINVPFFYMTDISGVSPNDVWAVGPGGDLDKTIWHYDGKHWSTDGISRGISPWAVFAIEDVVWIAGSDGIIWKHENGVWAFSAQLKLEGYQSIGLDNVWGSSKTDIYAVGTAVAENDHVFKQSIIAHYDGNDWKLIDTGDEKCSFTSIKKDPISKQYFVSGKRNEPYLQDTSKLFILKNEKLKKVEWEKENVDDRIFISITDNELLFGMGDKIKYLSNGKFITLLDVSMTNYNGGFGGRNKNDIFLGLKDGIMHYNGNNLEYIYNAPNGVMLALGRRAIFEKEYFQIEFFHNYIIHGKLKE